MILLEIEKLISGAEASIKEDKYIDAELAAKRAIEFLTINHTNDTLISEEKKFLTRAYRILSESLWLQGMAKDSLSIAEKALNISIEVSSREDEAKAMGNIGIIYAQLSEFSTAIEYMLVALRIHIELGNKANAAGVTGNIGTIYRFMSDYPQALKYYSEALNFHDSVGNFAEASKIMSNIGVVYEFLSDYPLALEFYEKALFLHEKLGMKSATAVALSNIGIVHRILCNYKIALAYYSKAIAIHEEIGDKMNVAVLISNIGILYQQLLDYDRALEYLNKAFVIQKELGAKGNMAITTSSIGIVYAELKDYTRALEYYTKAQNIYEELGMKTQIAIVKCNIGNVYQCLSRYQNSLEFYMDSIAEYESLEDKIGIAINTGNVGALFAIKAFDGFNLKKAEEYMLKSIELHKTIGINNDLFRTHQHLANLYKDQKRWEEYSEHIEKYHELYIEVQNEEVKKQADRFGWERKIADMEKQKEIEAIKTDADKRLLEETINFQKQSLEQQAREVKNTVDELVRKNSLLQLIQSDLKKIAPHTKREGTDYIDQLLERVTRNITPLESNQQLDKQLTEVHGEFISNLHQKFPDLTTMELKIAALLSMKLTSSNIAAALFLAKRTVESHRFSLRKKMGLGTSDDIYQALAQYAT